MINQKIVLYQKYGVILVAISLILVNFILLQSNKRGVRENGEFLEIHLIMQDIYTHTLMLLKTKSHDTTHDSQTGVIVQLIVFYVSMFEKLIQVMYIYLTN